ncbi:hypothetical protein ACFFRT_12700 [Enterococcus thailandicus]|uniref:Uncharacterized protein n=2 Tax=Enterococcus thailandicus TaxID=417368 RepID=A0A510WGV2_ENTTH|nr:hypothetical protein [Enterococcus thailandicus]GEK38167.1 hypothetical protein ETH01_24540 [Enterococcus thailandicus]
MTSFKAAFSRRSEEEKARIDKKLKKIEEEITRKCLALGFTEHEIEDAYQAFEKDYEALPNFVSRPFMEQYMSVEYRKSPNRKVFETEETEF